MATSRLKLDFNLKTNIERKQFLDNYLRSEIFTKYPPTEDELEMMGNYVLWGKDPVTGLNSQQEGLLTIETKHKTWDKNNDVESLDGLMEVPTFNEATLRPVTAVPYKVKREVFNRKDALRDCPEYMRDSYLQLFQHIDELDMCINLYELAHGKRKNPPRDELLRKFDETALSTLHERVSHWNQFRYLKMRHQLVELRREAYTLRDAYRPTIMGQTAAEYCEITSDPELDVDIEVLPLGAWTEAPEKQLLFRIWRDLIPTNYSNEDLEVISDLLWKKKNYAPSSNQHWIDFRDLEHVYQIFQVFFELTDAATVAEFGSNLPALMRTLEFYVQGADLTDIQREILDMKLRKIKNQDIAIAINSKWKKSYTPNYISTIFRQRIIPKINDAAKYHEKVVGNLFFEEEFKTCTGCGVTMLRDSENFTRKSRSADGFTTRCKRCEKEARNRDKGE